MTNEMTYDDLKAIQFALSFTYWLHKAAMHKPQSLDILQGKVWRMKEAAELRQYELAEAN